MKISKWFKKNSYINLFFSSILMICFLGISSCSHRSGNPRVLVFSKNTYFFHTSIPNGIAAITKLGVENGFDVDTTTNASYFNEDSLKNYAAVIFLNTADNSGSLLNNYQEAEFERYIQSGGGYVGIHAASDAEQDWGWYGRLVGGYFNGHANKQQEAELHVTDSTHPATKGLPAVWKRQDEWYNFKKLSKDVHVLITIDESTYTGGTNGTDHPMSWYHDFDGGRAFYTALGHTEESYTEPLFLQHILGGIKYAIGDNKKPDYSKARSLQVPEENRFVKTTLVQATLFEPTEMAVLPNLDVLIIQRRGELMLYSSESKSIKQVGFLNVYWRTSANVNAEDGLLGLAADPDFKNNHFIYVFYSPFDTSVNRLSRFEFKNDTLDLKSEKIILQFYSQREICCHTGGSIAFGNDNMLFLSAGDNSTPFNEPNQQYVNNGFGPLNDAPGHLQYDARRSAGNTNDLRGKIMRIHVKPDGSYDIPEGNLFVNNPKGRPEIYVMGNRNPYRISVDKKTGFLYWGEVGPDAGNDSLETRGPRGYDEVNQARNAGYFGWPLFVGNNYAYHSYDYITGKSGPAFDPAHPVNDSRNNTGLRDLPPAQPAFIWYPYANSPEFPQVGTGGRNAMAGPVYYADDFPKETRFPDYYNKKLFIYDWIRGWIKAVTMLPNGDFDKMEPFMGHTKFSNPIDMEMGPDGRLYILEYGTGWFSRNQDAGLSRIDYLTGNRPPQVGDIQIEKTSGNLPFTLKAAVKASDPENDAITYIWTIGTIKQQTKIPELNYTIKAPGEYATSVEVIDDNKASSKSNSVNVYAGNERPHVDINIEGNQSFYFAGKPVIYKVNVSDNGDSISWNNLLISTSFTDEALTAENVDEAGSPEIAGRTYIQSLDCKSCHKVDEKSVGPSFTEVAERYYNNKKAPEILIQKIIKGGSGAWGEVDMPAHPTLEENDVKQIVQYVLSLKSEKTNMKSLPAKGQVMPSGNKPDQNVFVLKAAYTDNGSKGLRPLSANKEIFLTSNNVDASMITHAEGFAKQDSAGVQYLIYPQEDGVIKMEGVDLKGIHSILISNAANIDSGKYLVEIKINGTNGRKIGEGIINKQKNNPEIKLEPLQDNKLHDIYIIIHGMHVPKNKKLMLKQIKFLM
ncbi:MAG: ThuA domain-containing protein [Ginsengibacter sp.]